MSLSDVSDLDSCSWDSEACDAFVNSPNAFGSLVSDCEWSSDDSTSDNDIVQRIGPLFLQKQRSNPYTSINSNSVQNLQPQNEVLCSLNRSMETCEWSDNEVIKHRTAMSHLVR